MAGNEQNRPNPRLLIFYDNNETDRERADEIINGIENYFRECNIPNPLQIIRSPFSFLEEQSRVALADLQAGCELFLALRTRTLEDNVEKKCQTNATMFAKNILKENNCRGRYMEVVYDDVPQGVYQLEQIYCVRYTEGMAELRKLCRHMIAIVELLNGDQNAQLLPEPDHSANAQQEVEEPPVEEVSQHRLAQPEDENHAEDLTLAAQPVSDSVREQRVPLVGDSGMADRDELLPVRLSQRDMEISANQAADACGNELNEGHNAESNENQERYIIQAYNFMIDMTNPSWKGLVIIGLMALTALYYIRQRKD